MYWNLSIWGFSLSQFVMWNDIRNRSDELMENKIVRSLMDGRLCWDAQPMTLDKAVPEDEVLLPLSADASQLYAIRAAGNGESFVLHGPPGTGKSQTITALIANSLAQGQSVLFVAEKMAALEVVQKRLAAIGIAPFCMELHSNKSKKKDVLEQLHQAMDVTRGQSCPQYQQKAEQISFMRKELEQYGGCTGKEAPVKMRMKQYKQTRTLLRLLATGGFLQSQIFDYAMIHFHLNLQLIQKSIGRPGMDLVFFLHNEQLRTQCRREWPEAQGSPAVLTILSNVTTYPNPCFANCAALYSKL